MSHDGSRSAGPGPSRRRRRLVVAGATVAALAATVSVVSLSVLATSRSGGPEPATTPDVAALAGPLADQEVVWEDCVFGEGLAAPLPGADLSNVRCATIEVPRDWRDPEPGLTWDVRISMAHNIDVSDPAYGTTVVAHPGGPYSSGLSFASTVQHQTPQLRPTTNYVSFDQRGLGQSSHASCDYEYPAGADTATQVRAAGEACSQDPDVATMTTEQAAYDTDFIRHLLGLGSVTYLGYSYGTWLGTWYGTLFGENVDRMVFDSSVDSTQESIQTLYESAHAGRDRQFRLHLLNFTARHDATYGLGEDPEAIWHRYFAATDGAQMTQAAYWAWSSTGLTSAFATARLYPDAAHLVRLLIGEGEAGRRTSPAETVDRIIGAMPGFDETRRAGARAVLAGLVAAQEPVAAAGTVRVSYDELIEFTRCTDGAWTQGLEYWQDFNERTARVAPFSAQLNLLSYPPTCAFWPTDARMPTPGPQFPRTLVLQSELDAMTPFEQGRAAALGLPGATLLAVDDENAHGVFPHGTELVDGTVVDFLGGGGLPAGPIVAPGRPIAPESSTYESWAALDGNAQHDGDEPRFTDPWIPAGPHPWASPEHAPAQELLGRTTRAVAGPRWRRRRR